jgi:predicted Rossmann fold nucleotide-binding protein DprA/Smf involved in DNA uptake
MSDDTQPRKSNYAVEQIKAARARRGPSDPARTEAYKRGKEVQNAVLQAIADEARTVPEIAEATGLPTQEVMWWVTALRKYGKVQDEGKRGDYIAYKRK